MSEQACPLCFAQPVAESLRENHRKWGERIYYHCSHCQLVFLASECRPSRSEEKACYDLHQNDPNDPRYQKFLQRLITPLLEHLPEQASTGLDYGCGPSPVLASLLGNLGYQIALYDPFYFPKLTKSPPFDFITCTEVVEHFYAPYHEFSHLLKLLKPGGLLAIMTEILLPNQDFANWRYRQEQTHVCFYQQQTFQWLAKHWQWQLHFPCANVIFLQKNAKQQTP